MWIGLNDRIKEGTYIWSDGSSVEYTNWKTGEPSGEDCTAYEESSYGTMSDLSCSEKHQYVCKQPLEGSLLSCAHDFIPILSLEQIIVTSRCNTYWQAINTSKRTEWSPIQSVIIRAITKSNDRECGSPIC